MTFQLCCIATVFADSVTDDFDNADSWSVNIPEIYENGGESYAHLKHTSAMKAFTQYKFTPPSNSADGKFVVEARVKNPSASMSLMTVYLKNVSTSAVQLRSQYTSLNDGYMWRNLKGDKPVSKIKNGYNSRKARFYNRVGYNIYGVRHRKTARQMFTLTGRMLNIRRQSTQIPAVLTA
ncbi:MAG: hypothetical protein L6V93_21935 [Clostridiales bacterium]|nr:MAG: hypothetical protein L6V93_21935 [Clostridiales bacterium]